MIAILLALATRLPRPGRRRRPVVAAPPASPVAVHPAVPYGRRCALLNPYGTQVEVPPGSAPAGRHRVRVQVQFVGDDYPTVPIRMDAADTVEFPRVLLTAFAPVPAAVGAR